VNGNIYLVFIAYPYDLNNKVKSAAALGLMSLYIYVLVLCLPKHIFTLIFLTVRMQRCILCESTDVFFSVSTSFSTVQFSQWFYAIGSTTT